MIIDLKTFREDAYAHGVSTLVENSRFKLTGKASEVRRVIALQGYDIIENGRGVWSVETDGDLVGTLCSFDENYAYFFTVQF